MRQLHLQRRELFDDVHDPACLQRDLQGLGVLQRHLVRRRQDAGHGLYEQLRVRDRQLCRRRVLQLDLHLWVRGVQQRRLGWHVYQSRQRNGPRELLRQLSLQWRRRLLRQLLGHLQHHHVQDERVLQRHHVHGDEGQRRELRERVRVQLGSLQHLLHRRRRRRLRGHGQQREVLRLDGAYGLCGLERRLLRHRQPGTAWRNGLPNDATDDVRGL